MAKKAIYQRYECNEITKYINQKTQNVSGDKSKRKLSYWIGRGNERTIVFYSGYVFTQETGFSWSVKYSINFSPTGSGHSLSQSGWLRVSDIKGYYVNSGEVTSDGFVYFYYSKIVTCDKVKEPVKGTYLNDIIADYGSLPTDGRHSDGYWYVFVKMASDLKANVNGIWRDAPESWTNVGGIWKPQSEFKANVNGIYK